MELDLNTLREEIDAIDRDIVKLFCSRMEISGKVSAYKAARTGRGKGAAEAGPGSWSGWRGHGILRLHLVQRYF